MATNISASLSIEADAVIEVYQPSASHKPMHKPMVTIESPDTATLLYLHPESGCAARRLAQALVEAADWLESSAGRAAAAAGGAR